MTAPPTNFKAEQAVLGALLRSESDFWSLSNVLRADHFASPLHRQIFTAIHDIHHSGQRMSLTLVGARLPDETEEGTLMPAVLAVLARNAEDVGSPLDFVDDIVDAWARRRLIKIHDEVIKAANDRSKPVADTIADLEASVIDLSRGAEAKAEEQLKTVMVRVVDRSAEAYQDQYIPGFDTGLPSLDEILGRMMPGDLGVVGGGVGESKTSIATQLLCRAASLDRGPALMIQEEMPAEDIARRILAAQTGLSVTAIEEGAFNFDEFDRIKAGQKALDGLGLYIYAAPQMRLGQIRSRCVSMKRSRGLSFVVVDSLKRTRPDGKVRDFIEATDQVTSGLKALALELGIVVIALSHRTRKSQDRDDPRPWVTDFYGGGSIEENADWIIGLWRRELWLQQRRPSRDDQKRMDAWAVDLERSRGIAEAICLKRRRGEAMKEAKFRWNGNATRFEELER